MPELEFAISPSHALPLCAVLGASIGSFLNVVIYRLPRGESIVHPGSHCPRCGNAIPAWLNVPVVAWLVLRGRCRDCREPISMRYPLVELVTAVLFVALYLWGSDGPRLLADWALASALVAVFLIDLDEQIIPNEITYPGIPLALVAALLLPRPHWGYVMPAWLDPILGLVVGGGMLWGISSYYLWRTGRLGLGFGDVKLVAMMGAFLGFESVISLLVVGSVLAIVHWSVLALAGRAEFRTRIAFGPALSIAGVAHIFTPNLVSDLLRLSSRMIAA